MVRRFGPTGGESEGGPVTRDQQADYLKSRGWKREGLYWRDKLTRQLWEQDSAVGQQKLRDREADGKDGGIPQGKRLANP